MTIAADIITADKNTEPARPFLLMLGVVIVVLTAYHCAMLSFTDFSLFVDEAYYWGWAQHLDFGYYSKPPMIAGLIALTTSVCGDGEMCVKAGALLVHPLTALLIFFLAKALFDARIGFYSAVCYLTMPGIAWSSLIISTDVVLLFFWAAAMYLFRNALHTGGKGYWLAAGVAGGLGLLSKYNFMVFPLSVFLFLFSASDYKDRLKQPGVYIAMVVAVAVFLPNLIWNAQHGFPTFQHTAEISRLSQNTLHLDELTEFIGGQFGVFGVVFFPVLLYVFASAKPLWNNESYRFLICFALPFLVLICLQAFLGRAHANWATPTYVAGSILVTAYLIHRQKFKWWIAALVINLLLTFTAYHWHYIAKVLDFPLTAKNDPFKRVQGWQPFAHQVERILQQYPSALLLGDSRTTLAELIYYIRPHPFNAVVWNPQGLLRDHYDLTTTLNDKLGKDFIFVAEGTNFPLLAKSFESVTPLSKIHIPIHRDYALDYHVFYLHNFLGYPASPRS